MNYFKSIFISLALISSNSFAATDCTTTIDRIWAGDEGYIWFHLNNNGSFKMSSTDLDQKSILAMGMTALTTGNSIVVRYHEDNADCTSGNRDDLRGIYLYGRTL